MELPLFEQSIHHGRHPSRTMVVFTQVLPRRLKIDQQRDIKTDLFPILDIEIDAHMTGNGIDVDWSIRRTANR